MTDGVRFDFSDLSRLAADLDAAADDIEPFVVSAVKFTSVRIKRGAGRRVSRRRHFKQAAQAIDFDVTRFRGFGAAVVKSEIGYDKGRTAGALGNLIEFGAPGSANALAPGNELVATLREEEPDFIRGIGRAVDDSLKKRGL